MLTAEQKRTADELVQTLAGDELGRMRFLGMIAGWEAGYAAGRNSITPANTQIPGEVTEPRGDTSYFQMGQ